VRLVSVDPPTFDPEIVRHDDGGFRVAWSGPVEYDASKPVRDIFKERRDRFLRKLDIENTRRTKGVTPSKCLPQPKQVRVVFPLTPANP
jgi:hypothetical protein